MQYRIKETQRLGLKLFIGVLFAADGRCIAMVEAWSIAGCLTALKKQAVKLSA